MQGNIFGKNLKEERKTAHKLQRELADYLNVEKTRISNWETGKAEPDLDMLKIIAKYFDVTVDSLLE